MTDVRFAYGFTPVMTQGGRCIERPLLRARLAHRARVADVPFLLDSGADQSMIPRELAEAGLGLDVRRLPEAQVHSVGDAVPVGVVMLRMTVWQGERAQTLDASFHIPKDRPGYPRTALLGREPLFRHFDILFRLRHARRRGTFLLKKVPDDVFPVATGATAVPAAHPAAPTGKA